MPVHRVAKNMKKVRPAKRGTVAVRKPTTAGNGSGARDADKRAANGRSLTKTINRLFAQENWAKARSILEKEMAAEPDSHWLRTRLGTTYYEERNYERALEEIEQAYRRAPNCPLVLWDYAGTLHALGRTTKAIGIYGQLLAKGVDAVAHEECGEGVPWAMGLLTDCYYRLGICHAHLGEAAAAGKHFTAYIILSALSRVKSIYTVEEALARLRQLPALTGEASAKQFEATKKELRHRLNLSSHHS